MFDANTSQIPIENTPWPNAGLLRASVSSFGFGGSNVHVVLDDALHYLQSRSLDGNHYNAEMPGSPDLHAAFSPTGGYAKSSLDEPHSEQQMLFVWFAANKDSLQQSLVDYKNHLKTFLGHMHKPVPYLRDLAYTFSCKRIRLRWRSFVVASNKEDLQLALEQQAFRASLAVRSNSASKKIGRNTRWRTHQKSQAHGRIHAHELR